MLARQVLLPAELSFQPKVSSCFLFLLVFLGCCCGLCMGETLSRARSYNLLTDSFGQMFVSGSFHQELEVDDLY